MFELLNEQGECFMTMDDEEDYYEGFTFMIDCLTCDEKTLDNFLERFNSEDNLYLKEMPFGRVFSCLDRKKYNCCEGEVKEEVESWEKIRTRVGCIVNMNIKELRLVCAGICREKLDKALQKYGDDKEEIKVMINSVDSEGRLRLDLFDEQNNYCGDIMTKYATTNVEDLDDLAEYLGKNNLNGKTPFTEVFCSYYHPDKDSYKKTCDIWKKLCTLVKGTFFYKKPLYSYPFYIEIAELKFMCSDCEKLEKQLQSLDEGAVVDGKVKIKITGIGDGYLNFVLNGKDIDNNNLLTTRYAVADNKAIEKLVNFIEQIVAEYEDIDKNNVKNNNNVEMGVNS